MLNNLKTTALISMGSGGFKMDGIKAGEVKVLEVDNTDAHKGIKAGDVYEVVWVKLTGEGGVAVRINGRDSDILFPSQIKKVDAPTTESNNIEIGDWIEVVRITGTDEGYGICKGDKFEVINKAGHTIIAKVDGEEWLFDKSYVKKIDNPAKERPASDHYQNANGNDVWQFMDDNFEIERVKGFHQGNALKYITRYSVKHDEPQKRIEDLRKAKVYIDKLIELEQMK